MLILFGRSTADCDARHTPEQEKASKDWWTQIYHRTNFPPIRNWLRRTKKHYQKQVVEKSVDTGLLDPAQDQNLR